MTGSLFLRKKRQRLLGILILTIEPGHSIFYKIACASCEDSDQHAHVHPGTLIKVFARPPVDALDSWLPTELPENTLI